MGNIALCSADCVAKKCLVFNAFDCIRFIFCKTVKECLYNLDYLIENSICLNISHSLHNYKK